MRYLSIAVGLCTALLLAACGDKYDKFTGYWQLRDDEYQVAVIKKVDANTYTFAGIHEDKNGIEGRVLTKMENGEFEYPLNKTRMILSEDGQIIRAGDQVWNRLSEQQAEQAWKKIEAVLMEQQKNQQACLKLQDEYEQASKALSETFANSNGSSEIEDYFNRKSEQDRKRRELREQYDNKTAAIPGCEDAFRRRFGFGIF